MESTAENIRDLPSSAYLNCPVRLSDGFMEIIAYTGDLLEKFKTENIGCEEVSRNYAELLSFSEDLIQLWGFSPAQWKDSLFPVCALIDELLMCSEWKEKEEWQKNQLQLAYFGTANAGEEFFRRLAELERESPENSNAVREVYAFCLAMGFRGKYYGPQDAGRLRDIKNATLRAVTGEIGPDISEVPGMHGTLFPGAYGLEKNFSRKKMWNRKLNALNILMFLLPVAAFTAMFIVYRNILGAMVDNFFK